MTVYSPKHVQLLTGANQQLLNCSLSSFDNEIHASNVTGLETKILLRHGGCDTNVPPENGRYLKEEIDTWSGGTVQLDEVTGKDHWWPTVFRERQDVIDQIYSLPLDPGTRPQRFTMTVVNPHEAGPKYGLRILELEHVGRIARLHAHYVPETATVEVLSKNAKAIHFSPDALQYLLLVKVNGQPIELDGTAATTSGLTLIQSANNTRDWTVVNDDIEAATVYPGGGLMQFLRTDRVVIIAARHSRHLSEAQLSMAYRMSHMLYMSGGINSDVLWDDDAEVDQLCRDANVVLLGSEDDNALLQTMARECSLPAKVKSRYINVGSEVFNLSGSGMALL